MRLEVFIEYIFNAWHLAKRIKSHTQSGNLRRLQSYRKKEKTKRKKKERTKKEKRTKRTMERNRNQNPNK